MNNYKPVIMTPQEALQTFHVLKINIKVTSEEKNRLPITLQCTNK